MTPSELKSKVSATGSSFFDRDSMRFFGDTMKNYGVRSALIMTHYDNESGCYQDVPFQTEVWELYRKSPVKYGKSASMFFLKTNFKHKF